METGGTTRVLRCSYLVGCDGSHSMVRRGLGFRYQGVDAIRKFVSTFVRSAELGGSPRGTAPGRTGPTDAGSPP